MPLRHYTGLDKATRQHFRVGGMTVTYLETSVVPDNTHRYTLSSPLLEGDEIELTQAEESDVISVWVHHQEGDAVGYLCLGSLEKPIAFIVAEALKRGASVGAEVLQYTPKAAPLPPDITLMIEIDEGQEEGS